jgi:hypothetical protein
LRARLFLDMRRFLPMPISAWPDAGTGRRRPGEEKSMKSLALAFIALLALGYGSLAFAQSLAHVAPPRGEQSQTR